MRKGDRVAIAMRNFPEWSIAFWAAAAAGAVVVPLNAWWTGPELEYGLSDSGSVVAFVDDERHERLTEHYAALPDLRSVIVAKASTRSLRPRCGSRTCSATSTLAHELPEVALDPEDDATIFYTSGTTGRPKGALGTQRNICTNLMSLVFASATIGCSIRTRRPSPCREPASRTRICCRCRSSTPPDATRCSWPTSRSAGRS